MTAKDTLWLLYILMLLTIGGIIAYIIGTGKLMEWVAAFVRFCS